MPTLVVPDHRRDAAEPHEVHVPGAHLGLGHVGEPVHEVGVAGAHEDEVGVCRLGLAHDAAAQTVRKRYLTLARRLHPDKSDDPDAAAKMRQEMMLRLLWRLPERLIP